MTAESVRASVGFHQSDQRDGEKWSGVVFVLVMGQQDWLMGEICRRKEKGRGVNIFWSLADIENQIFVFS